MKPVMELLVEIDDHLQSMQHYGHSSELRDAMMVVSNLIESLKVARVQLSIIGGDPARDNPDYGDQVQRAAIEVVDAALSASQGDAA